MFFFYVHAFHDTQHYCRLFTFFASSWALRCFLTIRERTTHNSLLWTISNYSCLLCTYYHCSHDTPCTLYNTIRLHNLSYCIYFFLSLFDWFSYRTMKRWKRIVRLELSISESRRGDMKLCFFCRSQSTLHSRCHIKSNPM